MNCPGSGREKTAYFSRSADDALERTRKGALMTSAKHTVDDIIEEIVQAVVAAAAPERIILFGSAARGGIGPDSDVDLLVIEEESSFHEGSRRAECSRIRRALWRFSIPIDVLLFTPEEMDKWKDATNHVIARSVREGKIVYVRP